MANTGGPNNPCSNVNHEAGNLNSEPRLSNAQTLTAATIAMIVDINTNVWSMPQHLGSAGQHHLPTSTGKPWDWPSATTAAHSRAMEEVDYAIVHGLHSRHAGACLSHEQVAAIVATQPGKLLGFAGIDPLATAPDQSIDEAIGLSLIGVSICPAGQAMHPCHSRAMALYETCQNRGLPVYVQSAELFRDQAVMAFAKTDHWDEVVRTFPNLRLVIAQIGQPWIEPTLNLLSRHAHLYADVSGLVHELWPLYNALILASQYGAEEKLLFGSGFPFCTPRQAIINIYSVNRFTRQTQLPTVPRKLLRGIVERDLFACLGIERPAPSEREPHAPLVGEESG